MIPSTWYTEGDAFQLERRTVFAHAWLMISRADALLTPGAFLSINLAGWPLLAMRGDDSEVRAFRNTCRHQRMIVVERAAGQAESALRCRYHGWTYDLRGRFLDAPAQYAPADQAAPDNNLLGVVLAEWHELLFVRLAPDGEPFRPVGAPADWPFSLASPLGFESESTTDFSCNWKVLVEYIVATADARSGTDFTIRFQWPNLVIATGPGEMIVHQIVPRTFSRTRVHTHFFFSATAPSKQRIAAVAAELDADRALCERKQEALAAGGAPSAASDGSPVGRFRALVTAALEQAPLEDPLARAAT